MVEQDVSCLPVVTGTFLVGMVTRDALATAGLGRRTETIAGGCAACGSDRRSAAIRARAASRCAPSAWAARRPTPSAAWRTNRGSSPAAGPPRPRSRPRPRRLLDLTRSILPPWPSAARAGSSRRRSSAFAWRSVRGARAVDVGASTGGFTEALLAHGARQRRRGRRRARPAAPALRADPRVTSLEGVDWKRLSLAVAEGPFDFFTVDVSFVAARNMLRALAFRLRAGAEGVVLVKPQFELPDRGEGAGADKARCARGPRQGARARARARLHAGRSLRLAGRGRQRHDRGARPPALRRPPCSMPRPGERRPAAAPRAAAPAARRRRRCAGSRSSRPGSRRSRARARGAARHVATSRSRRAASHGRARPPAACAPTCGCASRRACWRASATSRRASSASCAGAPRGCRGAGSSPPGAAIAVRASATRCRLYHTGALAEAAVLAIADAVPGVRAAGRDEDADVTLLVRGVDDRFTFSADASGERLHRRGARVETGAAPLRETLAAGLLALAGWTPGTALCDPMCGAGTIVIEAAMQALGRAPGARARVRDRALAARGRRRGRRALAALRARPGRRACARRTPGPPIVGSDRDAADRKRAPQRRARRVVGARDVRLPRRRRRAPPAPAGLVVTNPPYGRRLGDARAAARGYRDLGRVLRAHFRGWRAAVRARAADAAALGLPSARFPLLNGGLRRRARRLRRRAERGPPRRPCPCPR